MGAELVEEITVVKEDTTTDNQPKGGGRGVRADQCMKMCGLQIVRGE